jgi:hypothetical protein
MSISQGVGSPLDVHGLPLSLAMMRGGEVMGGKSNAALGVRALK